MKTKEICAAADWLAANPDKHTTTVLARNAQEIPVSPFDPKAVCFCAYGRVLVEVGDEAKAILERDEDEGRDPFAELKALTGLDYGRVYGINDSQNNGKARAIRYLREQATC